MVDKGRLTHGDKLWHWQPLSGLAPFEVTVEHVAGDPWVIVTGKHLNGDSVPDYSLYATPAELNAAIDAHKAEVCKALDGMKQPWMGWVEHKSKPGAFVFYLDGFQESDGYVSNEKDIYKAVAYKGDRTAITFHATLSEAKQAVEEAVRGGGK